MARLASRNTRSDKQRNRRKLLNTETMDFWVRTRMPRRLPMMPKELVRTVATPEHQNKKV
jgi:hypothetical protein